MSTSIYNATIRIGATAEDVAAAVNSAISHFQRLTNTVTKDTGASLSQLRRLALEVGAAFGGLHLTHFVSDAVQKYERAVIAFEVMLKSAEKARGLIRDIQNFEFETPLKFTELTGVTQRLLAAKFALEDVPTIMRIIGDAAAASGESIDFVAGRLARTFGEIKARGYVSGEELREFVNARISARAFIAEGMSKELNRKVSEAEVSEMVEKKAVDAGVALRSILSGLDAHVGGIQKRIGLETFEGLFKRMASQAELAFVEIALAMDKAFGIKKYLNSWVSTFTEMRNSASGFAEWMKNNLGVQTLIKGFQLLREIIGTVLDAARDFGRFLTGGVPDLGKELSGMSVNVQKVREDIVSAIGSIAKSFAVVGDVITKFLIAPLKLAFYELIKFRQKIQELKPAWSNEEKVARIGTNIALNVLKRSIEKDMGMEELKKQLKSIDEWMAGKNLQNQIELSPAVQMGFEAIRHSVDGAEASISKFHRNVKDLKSLNSTVDFSAMIKDLSEETKKYLDDARTPLEKLKDELAGLEDAFMFFELDEAAFVAGAGNALRRAAGSMKIDEPQVASGLTSGSEEAQRLIIEAMYKTSDKQVPDLLKELIRSSDEQTRVTKDLLEQAKRGGLVTVSVN